MLKKISALALAASCVLSAAAAAPRADVAEVVEAERAFARAAQEEGVGAAFRRFVAEEGIVFEPDPRPAKPVLAKRPDGGGSLKWWPVYAGIAASGDLGFTTGPWVAEFGGRKGFGHYFTIWKRGPDGSWRWVLDHGPPTREAPGLGPETPVTSLPAVMPARRRVRIESTWRDLLAVQANLDRELASDARAALPKLLADDGRVMRVGPQPAIGRAAYIAALASGPARIEAAHLGGGISKAGDLAYTYGGARWENEGVPRTGHYVRLWQWRGEGWKLIVDELIASPPP